MYATRRTHGPVELAFTDRHDGVSAAPRDSLDLALDGPDSAENLRLLLADFAPDATLADMRQVHGNDVATIDAGPSADRGGRPGARLEAPAPTCDALVTARPDVVLLVRVADCVPVLLADPVAGVVAAAHAGRPGMLAGVVPATVRRMRDLGARDITAWVGPHVCGGCYEVPEAMRDEVGGAVPASVATTTWGTPALDIGAGVRSQLEVEGVAVVDCGRCTRESPDLYSYRRDGVAAGRLAGLVRVRGAA